MPNFLANNYPQPSPPMNPLGILGQLQGLVHQGQINRLTGAQIAMGKNYAQATGPNGQINEGQLVNLTAQNPQTAMLAGEVSQQAAARVHSWVDAHTAQLGYAMTQTIDLDQVMGSAMLNATTPNLHQHIVQATAMKLISPAQAADLAATIPPGNNLAANKEWLLGHMLQNQQIGEQLRTIFGNYATYTNGAVTEVVRQSPVTGTHPVGSFPTQLTPATLAQPFSFVNPKNGKTKTSTVGAFLESNGLMPHAQAGPNIASSGPVPIGPEAQQEGAPSPAQLAQMHAVQAQLQGQPASGSLPLPQAPQSAATAPVGPKGALPSSATQNAFQALSAPHPTPPGGMPSVTTALGPGEQQALAVAGHQSAAALNALEDDIGNTSAGSQARLERMRLALHALENSSTGGGTEYVQETKNYIQGISNALGANFIPRMLGIPASEALAKMGKLDPTAQYALAKKYMVQIAMGQSSQLGSGTDAKLATAISGNPNTHMPQLASEDVLKVMMGLERYHQAEYASWQDHVKADPNAGPQDFLPWSAQWTLKTDPRIFLTPYMSPKQTQALGKSLSPAEQKTFIARWQEMKARGLL